MKKIYTIYSIYEVEGEQKIKSFEPSYTSKEKAIEKLLNMLEGKIIINDKLKKSCYFEKNTILSIKTLEKIKLDYPTLKELEENNLNPCDKLYFNSGNTYEIIEDYLLEEDW